jgi:hypothetical protein
MKTQNEPVEEGNEPQQNGLFHELMEVVFVIAIVGGLFAFIGAYVRVMWQVLWPFVQSLSL